MSYDIVGGRSGTRQNELAGTLSIIDGPSYMIPDSGEGLPFVQQPGRRAFEDEGRVDGGGLSGVDVNIQQDLALGLLTGGLGLARSFWPLDDDRTRRTQLVSQFGIYDPGSVSTRHSQDCTPYNHRFVLSLYPGLYCDRWLRSQGPARRSSVDAEDPGHG